MSKRATVNPSWLDRMLVGWGLRSLHTHGSGWPKVSPMLRDGIPTGRPPSEPFEMGGEDYRALDAAIEALPMVQRVAITRAYKPWTAPGIDALGFVPTSTWCDRLHTAALTLKTAMQRKTLAISAEPD